VAQKTPRLFRFFDKIPPQIGPYPLKSPWKSRGHAWKTPAYPDVWRGFRRGAPFEHL